MTAAGLVILLLLMQAGGAPRQTIAGQVRLKDGTPATAVRVAAMPAPRETVRAAEGQNYYATVQPAATTLTDGEGRYRLSVAPGRYVIVAGLVGLGTFHPSAADIDGASVVNVEREAANNIDVTMQTFPGARVAGRITPPPVAGAREYAALAGTGLGEMLEVPVGQDGRFEFGRIQPGEYLLNVFPNPPGQASLRFAVSDRDVLSLELVRPPVQTVSGRVVVEKGPLPTALLGFWTPQGHVGATIRSDLTFSVGLHAATHRVDLGGLPVGYEVRSVRVGSTDVTNSGIVVGSRDVSDVIIEVAVRRDLPSVRGRVAGEVPAGTRVQLTGPIVGTAEAAVGADGTFTVAALPPGRYAVRVAGRPDVPPVDVVVTSSGGEVTIRLPQR